MVAGIVLYNPDLNRLSENLQAIQPQVSRVYCVDNGSQNINDVVALFGDNHKIVLIKNEINVGIAEALNQLARAALIDGNDWIITLDQDSVVADNLVSEYIRYADVEKIGIVTCCIVDRSFVSYNQGKEVDGEEVKFCITSASMTNLRAWKKVGGFDSQMFIDWVDWDICLAFRYAGYKIIRAAKTHIIHELGNNTRAKIWKGHQLLITERSSVRNYYINRNWIYIARKWPEISFWKNFGMCLKNIIIASIYSRHKIQSIKALSKGLIDGLFIKTTPISRL